jgi:hypothetical protein
VERRTPAGRDIDPLAGPLRRSTDAEVQVARRNPGAAAAAGVAANQECVTYCAVGMRASLMYWAARSVGIPARVYVGSWQDWQRDSSNPIVREQPKARYEYKWRATLVATLQGCRT